MSKIERRKQNLLLKSANRMQCNTDHVLEHRWENYCMVKLNKKMSARYKKLFKGAEA
jgi:hypothetical protein